MVTMALYPDSTHKCNVLTEEALHCFQNLVAASVTFGLVKLKTEKSASVAFLVSVHHLRPRAARAG